MTYLTLSSVLIEILFWRSYVIFYLLGIISCDDEKYFLLPNYLLTNVKHHINKKFLPKFLQKLFFGIMSESYKAAYHYNILIPLQLLLGD